MGVVGHIWSGSVVGLLAEKGEGLVAPNLIAVRKGCEVPR